MERKLRLEKESKKRWMGWGKREKEREGKRMREREGERRKRLWRVWSVGSLI